MDENLDIKTLLMLLERQFITVDSVLDAINPERVPTSDGGWAYVDDLDKKTKKELLANGFRFLSHGSNQLNQLADPNCRWCKGTGRIKLLTSDTECDCIQH